MGFPAVFAALGGLFAKAGGSAAAAGAASSAASSGSGAAASSGAGGGALSNLLSTAFSKGGDSSSGGMSYAPPIGAAAVTNNAVNSVNSQGALSGNSYRKLDNTATAITDTVLTTSVANNAAEGDQVAQVAQAVIAKQQLTMDSKARKSAGNDSAALTTLEEIAESMLSNVISTKTKG